METVGSKIKEARLKKYISQRDLAKALDVSPVYISQIEQDVCRDTPSMEFLTRLTSHLSMDIDDITKDE